MISIIYVKTDKEYLHDAIESIKNKTLKVIGKGNSAIVYSDDHFAYKYFKKDKAFLIDDEIAANDLLESRRLPVLMHVNYDKIHGIIQYPLCDYSIIDLIYKRSPPTKEDIAYINKVYSMAMDILYQYHDANITNDDALPRNFMICDNDFNVYTIDVGHSIQPSSIIGLQEQIIKFNNELLCTFCYALQHNHQFDYLNDIIQHYKHREGIDILV